MNFINDTLFFIPSNNPPLLESFLEHFILLVQPKHFYLFTEKRREVPEFIKQFFVPYYSKEFAILQNKVIRENNFKYLCFLSDDMRFSKDWLKDAEELLKDYDVISSGYYEKRNGFENFKEMCEKTKDNKELIIGFNGGCHFIKREIYLKIGGVDENIETGWQDMDLLTKFLKENIKPVIPKKITMFHEGHMTLRSPENSKQTRIMQKKAKREFIEKYGIEWYNKIKKIKKNQTEVFGDFKKNHKHL